MQQPVVHIVDDDHSVVRPIASVVEAIGLRAETYTSADEFMRRYRSDGPACLVLDVVLPGVSGVVLQSRLAEVGCAIPIIVITGHADVRLAVRFMKNGAVDFLEKPLKMQELCDSIQEAIRIDCENWRRRAEREDAQERFRQLHPGERDVLERVAVGMTNRTIAAELGISVRTVENRRARMMKRLGVHTRAELLALLGPRGSSITSR